MAEDKDIDLLSNPNSVVILLNGMIQKLTSYVQHIDSQSNMVVGLGTALFVFSASRFHLENGDISWPLFVMAISSGLAGLVGLLAVNPPLFMRKKGQKESLFYHTKISRYESYSPYHEELVEMLGSENKYVEQAAIELYNIARFSYKPKRDLFSLARGILNAGLFVSFGLYLLIAYSSF